MTIAVIVYSHGTRLEEILEAVRDRLVARGDLRLGGLLPRLGERLSNGRLALLLDDLARGDTIVISQDLGPGSTGCILDANGLAQARTRLSESIGARPDVLFLGRFGKEEAAGRGIREEIGEAAMGAIACIIAVEEKILPAWIDFAGEDFTRLPAQVEAILAWADGIHPAPARAGSTA